MAEAVVHDLEPVEVEEQHRDAFVTLFRPRQLAAEALHEVRAVRQAGQRVVDRLVRERFAARAPLRDVLDLADEVERLAVHVAHERRAHRHPHGQSLVVQVALFQLAAGRVTRQEARHRLAAHVAVVGMAQIEDRRREQLRLAPAEDLHERPVHPEQPSVERGERHADGRVLERAAEPLLGLAQLCFGAPSIGEVAHADDDALDRGVVEEVGGHGFHDPPAAVGVAQAQLDPVDLPAGASEVEALHRDPAVVGMDEVEDVGTDEGLDVDPEDPLGHRAGVDQSAPGIDDGHDVVGVADHRPETSLVALQESGHLIDRPRRPTAHHLGRDDRQHDDRGQQEDRQDPFGLHGLCVGTLFPPP